MQIIICNNSWQDQWDEFIRNNSTDFGLLQLWNWGIFIEYRTPNSKQKKVFRLAIIDDNENILAVAQIIKMPLKLGKSYFYIPRGPILRLESEEFSIFNFSARIASFRSQTMAGRQFSNNSKISNSNSQSLKILFDEIRRLAKSEGVIFLRLDPAWQENNATRELMNGLGFDLIGQVQPKQTLILDLAKSEDELMAQMKSKTRYNIKVAQKQEIKIDFWDLSQSSTSDKGRDFLEYFDDFWALTEKTSSRQEIQSHPKEYYRQMVKVLGEQGILKIAVAKYQDKVIVANLVIFYGDWGVYLHGASDYEYRSNMAPFLLQWETIKLAQKMGKKYYDFWGVDDAKWPGVTRFKKGFAPQTESINYIGAWDEVYGKMWYNVNRLISKLRKIR